MIVTTKNSTYEVETHCNMFKITKIRSSNPESKFHKVGDVMLSDSLSVRVGGSMYFEGTQTSRVLGVEEVALPIED